MQNVCERKTGIMQLIWQLLQNVCERKSGIKRRIWQLLQIVCDHKTGFKWIIWQLLQIMWGGEESQPQQFHSPGHILLNLSSEPPLNPIPSNIIFKSV